MEKKKIVFLYTELASYFLACVGLLAERKDLEIHIIRWPVNSEAPFSFKFPDNIRIHERASLSDLSLAELVDSIDPQLIYCSGWMDKGYLQVCKKFRSHIPVIAGLDNQWTGSLKQRLSVLIAPLRILSHFTHAWVPGAPQKEYALRLGFKNENILTGFYSCDFNFFHSIYLQNLSAKQKKMPHRFIFVGRYYEFKGVTDLWTAFIELKNEMESDWELWCLGTGSVEPVQHPSVRHLGFVQPADLPSVLAQTAVFILPSRFEPWGVVVHEFAAAGFPLIVTGETGAASAFLRDGENGYIYKAGNVRSLKDFMKKMMIADPVDLCAMGDLSAKLASSVTPALWVEQLTKLI